jgi:hypothetical protein
MHAPPMNVGVESGYGQLVIELGIVGLRAFSCGFDWPINHAFRVEGRHASERNRAVSNRFVIFLYAFLLVFPMSFYGFVAYQDFVMNAYFWLILGILFRVSEFPRDLPLAQTTA